MSAHISLLRAPQEQKKKKERIVLIIALGQHDVEKEYVIHLRLNIADALFMFFFASHWYSLVLLNILTLWYTNYSIFSKHHH